MLYASIVAYTSLIVILYLVDQQALAHAIMVTGPLIMLCWVGMKTVVLLSAILQGLGMMAEGWTSIIQFLHYLPALLGKDREPSSGADLDEIWKELGLD